MTPELVAEPTARSLTLDRLARKHPIDHLRTHRRGAADPPLPLFGVALHESVAELLDVGERPVRPQLDRIASSWGSEIVSCAWVDHRTKNVACPMW